MPSRKIVTLLRPARLGPLLIEPASFFSTMPGHHFDASLFLAFFLPYQFHSIFSYVLFFPECPFPPPPSVMRIAKETFTFVSSFSLLFFFFVSECPMSLSHAFITRLQCDTRAFFSFVPCLLHFFFLLGNNRFLARAPFPPNLPHSPLDPPTFRHFGFPTSITANPTPVPAAAFLIALFLLDSSFLGTRRDFFFFPSLKIFSHYPPLHPIDVSPLFFFRQSFFCSFWFPFFFSFESGRKWVDCKSFRTFLGMILPVFPAPIVQLFSLLA